MILNPKVPNPAPNLAPHLPKELQKELTYSSYLKVKELTSLQAPLAKPAAHDELLFIVIHQVYELWFKLLLHEIHVLMSSMRDNKLILSFHILRRVSEIFKVLIQQLDVLETMTPTDFNQFRSNLNPASGFQSLQFRELEIISGANVKDYEKFAPLEPEWKPRLSQLANQSNLHQTFLQLLKSRGLVKSDSTEECQTALLQVYEKDSHLELRSLCEGLIGYDEQISLWRFRHVQMVERMIGMKRGTGGSLGVNYLRQTLARRFFPELWEVRTHLGGETNY